MSLNDWNQKELEDLNQQKKKLLEKYDEEKTRLKDIVFQKEQHLQKIKSDIDDLGMFCSMLGKIEIQQNLLQN